MVSSCCVRGCTEKFVKGGGISYFRISSKPEMQRTAWINALQRNGWIPKPHHRICSRHFITGTWNADPSHVDYVPTVNMNAEDEDGMDLNDASSHNDSFNFHNTSSNLSNGANSFTHEQRMELPSPKRPAAANTNTAANIRVPKLSSSSHYKSLDSSIKSANDHRRSSPYTTANFNKQAKLLAQKSFKSLPSLKLKSSHFCEHRDAHRNCCRVIRELAEENTILKTQVDVLLLEVQKLRTQNLLQIQQNGMSLLDKLAASQSTVPSMYETPTSAIEMNGACKTAAVLAPTLSVDSTEDNKPSVDQLLPAPKPSSIAEEDSNHKTPLLKAEDIEIVSNSEDESDLEEEMDESSQYLPEELAASNSNMV